MTNEELENIEAQKAEAKKAIAKGEALKRLKENEDYKLVIEDGYLTDYPSEIARAVAKNVGEYDPDVLCAQLKSINTLVGYTFQVAANHNAAEQTIQGLDEYLAELEDSDEE